MNDLPTDDSPIKENLELLIDTLKNDPDWNKRFGAASRLFRSGKEKAIDPLINALQNDTHKEIRRFCADLLGNLGDSRATWALVAVLRQSIAEKDAILIHHTIEALLKIRGPDLSGILISTVTDVGELLEVRVISLELLGRLADNIAVKGLIDIIKNPDTEGKIRAKAIEELVYTGNLAGLQLILDQLEVTKRKDFQIVVIRAINKTPFRNKTIVFRIGEILLAITEQEQQKGEKKDSEIINLIAETMRKLAMNINYDFKQFMDELITIRNMKKKK